jgi:hypothetical protein
MSVATPTAPRSINTVRLMLLGALLAALFAGALLLGRSGASAPGATGPVLQRDAPGGSQRVSSPPASAALPRLRHPAPKPTAVVKAAPTTVAPITPVAPTTPAPSTGGSGGGGGGGGGTIISG